MRVNAPQLPGGGWAQLELTGALRTNTLQCVRSLLFLALAFNDSYYHMRIEVCEIILITNNSNERTFHR